MDVLDDQQQTHVKQVNPPADPYVGQILDERYRILERLGSGGWSTVYRAHHVGLDSVVAVKVLHAHMAGNSESSARFRQEAQALSKVSHPGIVRVSDYGITSLLQPYLVLEYIEGKTLQSMIQRRGAIPVPEAIEIIKQACLAVQSAHDQGIIHRDIKPENILVQDNGAIKVVDFGLAKMVCKDGTSLTETGETVGSPPFMSPEQCRGFETDSRTDVYSTTCTLFAALTGKPPFQASNVVEYLIKHATEPAPRLSDALPDIPFSSVLEAIIADGLNKDSSMRIQSMRALVDRLNSVGDPVAEANARKRRKGLTDKQLKTLRLVNRVCAFLLAGLFVIALAVSAFVSWLFLHPKAAWETAKSQAEFAMIGAHNLPEADACYAKAIKLAQEAHAKPEKTADLFIMRGRLQNELQEHKRAIDSAQNALKILEESHSNNKLLMAECYDVITYSQRKLEKHEEALKAAEKSLELKLQHQGTPTLFLANSCLNIALSERSLKNPKAAKTHINQAIEYLKKINEPTRLADAFLMRSYVHSDLGEKGEARNDAEAARKAISSVAEDSEVKRQILHNIELTTTPSTSP